MKKFTKRFLSTLMAAVVTASGMSAAAVSAAAEELTPYPCYMQPIPGISLHTWEPPTQILDLSTSGPYDFEGNAERTMLYTNYQFTGVSTLCFFVENLHSSETVKITVYEVTDLGDGLYHHSTVTTKNVAAGDSKTFSVSVSRSKKYVLGFSAPCNVRGTVS